MPTQIALSENAVAVLRFEIRGWRPKNKESRLPAYRELAAVGVMEPVPGSELEYRFTEDGLRHREELLAEAQDRIERERYERLTRALCRKQPGSCSAPASLAIAPTATKPTARPIANWLRRGS